MMTAGEMIRVLSQLPSETPIVVYDFGAGGTVACEISIEHGNLGPWVELLPAEGIVSSDPSLEDFAPQADWSRGKS
jgi:hypothetical protein